MPNQRPNIFARAASSIADFFIRWWREATGPIRRSQHRNLFEALLRRFLLWVPVFVLVLALLGGVAFYFFAGWRAHDLTRKAMVNARSGNIQTAWLQIMSAKNLRGGSPEVRRTMVYVRSVANDSAASALWDELAEEFALTDEETKERARAAVRAGTDEQFATAIAALEKDGSTAKAGMLRSQRALSRGNMEQAITEARAAAGKSGDPENKMQLLSLLMRRYALTFASSRYNPASSKAAEEIIALVDELQGTDQGNVAVAVALGAFPQPADKARAWAESAMMKLSADNPALLPAARFMVDSGQGTARDYFTKLSQVFAGAEIEQQASFARWLNDRQMWDETLALNTAQGAARNTAAYQERGRALVGKQQWQELLAMTEAPSQAPESLQLILRGIAAKELGKPGLAPKSLSDAVRAALREGRLAQTLAALDVLDEGKLADPIIIESCASPGMADAMFRVARDRFGRRGQFASLDAAFDAASKAAPDAPSVRDYRRRKDMLDKKYVSPDETAAAVAAAPADPQARFTHALALFRCGRAADALGVFDDIDIFVDKLAPGEQAITIAIWEANGLLGNARSLRSQLNPHLLSKGEFALIKSGEVPDTGSFGVP